MLLLVVMSFDNANVTNEQMEKKDLRDDVLSDESDVYNVKE